ncbi:MAG: glutathione peroxidase [Gammaproteobacteria bacterium]|nr:glutathione peroxidase [Gammaproteobacteria bacterium]
MFQNLEGQKVPNVIFKTRRAHEWVDRSSDDVFAGKSVIVFSLPGAFTPTCSSSHVPRYNQLVPLFKANGIDDVICVSVNDAFVMNEWQRSQKADRVTFLPDGNGEFSAGMGLLVGKEDLGFGKRSWRYSMLVRDGVIEKMFVEHEEPGDPFHVSDADTMLKYLDPNGALPHDVMLFTRDGCPFCARAKGLLHDAGFEFEELVLNRDYTDQTLRAVSSVHSYPQVFIDGQRIGGSDDLEKWLRNRQEARARTAA